MVAYQNNSASQLEVIVKDIDLVGEDILINTTVNIPTEFATWVDAMPSQDNYALNISLRRSVTPVMSKQEQMDMNLDEIVFDLEDGT